MMHTPRRGDRRRGGFTLVELLVAITIFLILAGLTIAMVDFSLTSDRVPSATRLLQARFEGARDRAVYAGEPRGVRLLVEPGDTTVKSLIYVQQLPPELGRGWVDWDPDTPNRLELVVNQLDGALTPANKLGMYWNQMAAANLLLPGRSRIRVGQNGNSGGSYGEVGDEALSSSKVYTIAAVLGPTTVVLSESLSPAPTLTTNIAYEMSLPNSILPNEEPAPLPVGTVVDLDNSDLPDAWRLSSGEYSPYMDVMFSPRGEVIGPLAAEGKLHFVLAELTDVLAGNTVGFSRKTLNDADPNTLPGAYNSIEGQTKIVTLFTRSGQLSIHDVDPTDGNGDNVIDDPFRFAETGEEAK